MTAHPTAGQFHDLAEILEDCLRVPMLAGAAGVRITWIGSRAIARQSSVLLASYGEVCEGGGPWVPTISVNRRLDHAWVPAYFMRDTVGHELLHRLDIKWREGTEPHHERFRELEGQLPGHARAMAWYERNLKRLLGKARAE